MGESAGASSILHHLVSYGGPRRTRKPGPVFKKAILQSPAFFPQADDKQEKAIWDTFLSKTGATSLKELREVNEEVLKEASNVMIQQSPYGTFTFAPAVDDDYTPAPPSLLLQANLLWRSVDVMVANNGDEGLLFAPPHIQSDAAFRQYVQGVFPAMPSEDLDELMEKYPVGGSSTPRRNFVDRSKQALADVGVNCNTRHLSNALGAYRVYKYVFNMFPAIHGLDTFFTYYTPPTKKYPAPDEEAEVNARELQSYIVSYATLGYPMGEKPDSVPFYNNAEKKILELSGKMGLKYLTKPVWKNVNISEIDDVWVSDRCNFWADAPYWQPEDPETVSRKEL
ncbi:MAG: hypothetical protein Q9170_007598 [Blastenia crenularia]